MTDGDPFFATIRLAVFCGISGAIFALGFAVVCRALKWAPINITVNINGYEPVEPPEGINRPVGRPSAPGVDK